MKSITRNMLLQALNHGIDTYVKLETNPMLRSVVENTLDTVAKYFGSPVSDIMSTSDMYQVTVVANTVKYLVTGSNDKNPAASSLATNMAILIEEAVKGKFDGMAFGNIMTVEAPTMKLTAVG